jgi:hypothetical protein
VVDNSKVVAKLSGYTQVNFDTSRLLRAYGSGSFNRLDLMDVAVRVPNFIPECDVMPRTTEDRYYWFAHMCFRVGAGETLVLFPWAQDFSRKNGSPADRPIAVLTKGEVPNVEVNKTMDLLASELTKERIAQLQRRN